MWNLNLKSDYCPIIVIAARPETTTLKSYRATKRVYILNYAKVVTVPRGVLKTFVR